MIRSSSPRALLPSLLAAALLSACSAQTQPSPSASDKTHPQASDAQAIAAKVEAAPAAASIPASFTALGTEPFWSAQIDGGILTYSTPETPDGVKAPVERSDEANQASFAATIDDRALVLEIKHEPCSDGMSDAEYPMTVTLIIDGESEQGCAR